MKAATILGVGVLLLGLAPLGATYANTLSIDYYTIGEHDADANHLATGVFNNEVQNSIGGNDLPVLNTAHFGCSANCYSAAGAPGDVTAGGEITYWSPALNTGGAGGTSASAPARARSPLQGRVRTTGRAIPPPSSRAL